VLTAGDTVIDAVVSPVLHRYVPLPLTVSTVESPMQIAVLGPASTVTIVRVMTNVIVSDILQEEVSVATKLPLKMPAEV
jgi:hypothetical protein